MLLRGELQIDAINSNFKILGCPLCEMSEYALSDFFLSEKVVSFVYFKDIWYHFRTLHLDLQNVLLFDEIKSKGLFVP